MNEGRADEEAKGDAGDDGGESLEYELLTVQDFPGGQASRILRRPAVAIPVHQPNQSNGEFIPRFWRVSGTYPGSRRASVKPATNRNAPKRTNATTNALFS